MLETGIQITTSGLTVQCPRWADVTGLIHGVTTRAALPGRGKDDFFTAIRRAREAGAMPAVPTIGAEQVHGEHIEAICEPLELRKHPVGFRCEDELDACEFPATDALVTAISGMLIVIQTADCLPVFLVDRENQVAGLAHCGWRGLHQGLAGKTACAMIGQGALVGNLEAWLGPCIQAEQYEVGRELVEDFRSAFPGAPVSPNGTHLDLPAIARWQLEQAGLGPARIFNSGECTRGRMELYHSYRGDGKNAGRILSFIGFDGEEA